jgi:dethiobiotin synthetase
MKMSMGLPLIPHPPSHEYVNSLPIDNFGSNCNVMYIAGDSSSVGKSTSCMYILASLLHVGYSPNDLAYIKPVTQCEAEQSVALFCKQCGIYCVSIGPVVFYKGFTRAYLDGSTDTSSALLHQVMDAVNEAKQSRKFVLVDGVGYPSVGSICGVSNADVARAIEAPVLLIGKPGVGNAVDSYNLNAT